MSFGLVSTAEPDRPFLRPTLLHILIADARVLHHYANVNPQRAFTQTLVILQARDESHDDHSRISFHD